MTVWAWKRGRHVPRRKPNGVEVRRTTPLIALPNMMDIIGSRGKVYVTIAELETEQTVALFERVEVLEDVAQRVNDVDRVRLYQVVRQELEASPPVRPVAAARILELSEKTVRNWVTEGVLRPAKTSTPRLLIDANALHEVSHIVKEVRAAGKTRALLDEVYRRLIDATWLEREDLQESLRQMRSGQETVRVLKA